MKEMSGKERRMSPRIPVRQAVSIKAAKGLRRGETEDISLGGAFIRCEKPPPPDQKILLTFENHSSTMQFVLARVAWTNLESRGSSDKPVGMGVQFMQFLSTQQSGEKSSE